MNEKIDILEKKIKDLEGTIEKDIKRKEKRKNEIHSKIITYSLSSLIGGAVYLPINIIIKTFGITTESSIISILICALYGLIIAACARDSSK